MPPPSPPAVAVLNAHWSGPERAPVVVLVHGLGGSHRTWDRVVPRLSDRCRTVAVDLPGGRAMEAEAADLEGLLTGACIARATVAGHSMGGQVATALAERAPSLVGGLVLIDTAPTVASRLTTNSGPEKILRTPVLGRLAWARLDDDRRRAGLGSAFAPGAEVPETFVEDLRNTSYEAFVGSTTAIDDYLAARSLAERLAALEIPTEIVFGLADQRVDAGSLSVYEGLSHVHVTSLEGVGHSPPWEAPEAVGAAIDALSR